jgi:Xaa-Pro aminopeptidase
MRSMLDWPLAMVTIEQPPRVQDLFRTFPDGRRALPSFSLAERDRRYAAVRRRMQAEGLDCLIAAPGEPYEPQAASRYLTQIGGLQGAAWAVLPLEGEATAILSSEREHRMWSRHLEWPSDLRWGSQIDLLIARLKELKAKKVGVVGLKGVHHRPDGIIPYTSWLKVQAGLPDVEWTSASELLDRCRVVKDDEEIAVIQRITDADEAAIRRMVEVARPGVLEADLWLEISEVLTRATGDWPARLSLGSDDLPSNTSNTMALPVEIEDGSIVSQEIDARLQGYRGQCNHSILVGSRGADAYRDSMQRAIEVFEGLVGWLRPGVTVRQFLSEYEWAATRRRGVAGSVVMHTCGLGSDRPRVGVGGQANSVDWVIEPGWTFTIKTHFRQVDTRIATQVGEPVTVTASGARRLGHRHLAPMITG